MKYLLKLGLLSFLLSVILMACSKLGNLPFYGNGSPVSLQSSVASVSPTIADTSKTVLSFSWSNPGYAVDSSKVKYILEIDSTGRNFSKSVSYTVIGSLTKGFTGRDLNNLMVSYGFPLSVAGKIDARLTSSYPNNNEQYKSNVITVSVTPFKDSSVLTSAQTSVTAALATSTQLANTFSWSPAFKGYTGNVTYTLQYDLKGKNFVAPASMAIGTNVYTKSLTQADINNTALASGIGGGSTGTVEYRIMAVTATGATVYSNVVNVTISTYAIALYIVGGSSPAGWSPSAAIQMIPDPRFPGTFFAYANLTVSGYGIKFLSENTSWNSPTQIVYGDANGNGISGTITSAGGGNNVNVPADGIYRVTVDLANNKYYLQTGAIGAVGLVGAFQNWSPAAAIKMVSLAPNKFIFITNMTQNDEFKFHDGNAWDNSTNSSSRWFDLTGSGSVIIDGAGTGGNFKWTGATGKVRAIFDYSNVSNPQFSLTEGNGMWVIGDATVGGWSNSGNETDVQRPPLAYQGNGVWSGSVALSAGSIKFIVKKGDWGFSYGGSNGMISYQNGSNISIATAGTYTITVDEYKGKYTIQ